MRPTHGAPLVHSIIFADVPGCVPEMNKGPKALPCPRQVPAASLTLIQPNRLSSWNVFLSLFNSLTEPLTVDIVLQQEPDSSIGFILSLSGFKCFTPPIFQHRVPC